MHSTTSELVPLAASGTRSFTTARLAEHDTGFARLQQHASRFILQPACVRTQSAAFPFLGALLPRDVPMLVLYLPRLLNGELDELAQSGTTEWQRLSTDLLAKDVYLGWQSSQHMIVVPEQVLRDAIDEQYSFTKRGTPGAIAMLLVTATRSILRTIPVDDDLLAVLQACGSTCGMNYRPHRHCQDDELAAARHLGPALLYEEERGYDGRTIIHFEAWDDRAELQAI